MSGARNGATMAKKSGAVEEEVEHVKKEQSLVLALAALVVVG
jgi:hypothetical protein